MSKRQHTEAAPDGGAVRMTCRNGLHERRPNAQGECTDCKRARDLRYRAGERGRRKREAYDGWAGTRTRRRRAAAIAKREAVLQLRGEQLLSALLNSVGGRTA